MQNSTESVEIILNGNQVSDKVRAVGKKVIAGERISQEDGVTLFEEGPLAVLGALANLVRERKNGNYTYFNRNFHIEPTNLCVFDCKFCSYSRNFKQKPEAWELSEEDIYQLVRNYDGQPITEVHIVGGVHPKMGLKYFAEMIRNIKKIRPDLHVKAFTAVELEYMCRKAKMSFREGLEFFKEYGLNSLPGGGAEIFDEEIREKICADKCSSAEWLEIHETAHTLGIPSNATMLYGHLENYAHRIDHMERLRTLQDRTGGFNTFIPLKFRNKDNQMSDIPEVSRIEDLKTYAVSRIYLDNFNHVKAYWPMIGRETAGLSLSFGVDDLDGTIDDSTKIYSMAGSEEQNPTLTTEELVSLIRSYKRNPVERDTVYNTVKEYGLEDSPVTA